jgi:hypothetical protein
LYAGELSSQELQALENNFKDFMLSSFGSSGSLSDYLYCFVNTSPHRYLNAGSVDWASLNAQSLHDDLVGGGNFRPFSGDELAASGLEAINSDNINALLGSDLTESLDDDWSGTGFGSAGKKVCFVDVDLSFRVNV